MNASTTNFTTSGVFHVGTSTNPLIFANVSSSNVGIGTSTAGSKLDVYSAVSSTSTDVFRIISDVTSIGNTVFKIKANGDVFTDGATTIGTPADVAENYPVQVGENLPSGTVVALGTTTQEWSYDNGETASSTFMMTAIRRATGGDEALGVISTRPGILLGGNTINGAPVALSGRIPVLVTNENGTIVQGDTLVISTSTPGYAMKQTNGGYSIGRAISDMATSTNATTSIILMVVENKYKPVSISSLSGLALVASTTDLLASVSASSSLTSNIYHLTSVYDYIVEKLKRSNTIVTEYLALSMKAVTGYFDTLFAKEIYTDKMCVKKSDGTNICLTGDEVETMMNNSQLPLLAPPSNGGGGTPLEDSTALDGSGGIVGGTTPPSGTGTSTGSGTGTGTGSGTSTTTPSTPPPTSTPTPTTSTSTPPTPTPTAETTPTPTTEPTSEPTPTPEPTPEPTPSPDPTLATTPEPTPAP